MGASNPPMPILVIEDDRALATLLQAVLRRGGYSAQLVGRGDTALEALGAQPWDAVILDLMLPGMSGAEILQALRTSHPGLLSRIIVVTAASQAVLAKLDLRPLIWNVVRKPFDLDELLAEVRACIASHDPSPPEFSRWLEGRSRPAGAGAGLVALERGGLLEISGEYGFADGLTASCFPVLVGEAYPVCDAFRSGAPVWVESFTRSSGVPPLLPVWTNDGGHAVAAMPLLRAGGTFGAIGWRFDRVQFFDEVQREALARIAVDAAGHLEGTDAAAEA